MDNYNKYKGTFQNVIVSKFGVDKKTNLPELCTGMGCKECLFDGCERACTAQMREWLKKDDDKYNTTTFMKKFNRLV